MREFSKEKQMDNKYVQEIIPLAMKEMQIKLQGGPGSWLGGSVDMVFVLQICGKDFHPKNPLIISELGRQRQAREGWT